MDGKKMKIKKRTQKPDWSRIFFFCENYNIILYLYIGTCPLYQDAWTLTRFV